MVIQIFLSCHLRRHNDFKPTAEDARWMAELCKAHDVTGLTLYCDGDFFSILEGSLDSTQQVADAIGALQQVNIAKIMFSEAKDEREFEHYSIGVNGVDYSSDVSEAFQLTPDSFSKNLPFSPSPVLRALTNSFARIHKF